MISEQFGLTSVKDVGFFSSLNVFFLNMISMIFFLLLKNNTGEVKKRKEK